MKKLQFALIVPLALLLGCSAATVSTDDTSGDADNIVVSNSVDGPLQMMSAAEFQSKMEERLGRVVLLDMWATW